jgi:hypothetical protein
VNGIEGWYEETVRIAVKDPLKETLARKKMPSRVELDLSFGVILSGINSVREKFYKSINISSVTRGYSLDGLIGEIRRSFD